MQKIKSIVITTASIFTVAFLYLFIVNPIVLAESASSELSVAITPVLSLAIVDSAGTQNLISIDITPTNNGTFTSSSTNIITSTTNETGLTLTMNNNDTNTALTHTDSTIIANIPTLSTESTEATFPANTYGYNFNSSTNSSSELLYLPIPPLTTPTTLITTDSQGSHTWPFTIAAKADTSLPAGTYQDTIVISATTNYVPHGIESITTMQEMTSSVCADTPTPAAADTTFPEKTLIDERDNNVYTIRKLADSNCWMTQNLRLTGQTELTAQNSNIANSFTVPASTSGRWASGYTDTSAINVARTYYANNADYGAYYNYTAATAGSGSASASSGNASYSICPNGWRLPNSTEINTLLSIYSQEAFRIATNATASKAGYYSFQGSIYDNGASVRWWSSTIIDSSYVYYLYDSGNNINLVRDSKNFGFSVRCVAR